MEQSEIEVQGTPNPNAAKFVVEATLSPEGSRSYFGAEDAEGDPLAERLFEVEGVEALLIVDNFVTVTKAEGLEWADLVDEVKEALRGELEDRAGN